jgi:colanic acid biosynthesis glycosyl transferase WcaI
VTTKRTAKTFVADTPSIRILVHDYSGHPFQVQLSRALAQRGHRVVHSHCAAYVSGKGSLESLPNEALRFAVVGRGKSISKYRFHRRLFQEVRYGLELCRLIAKERPDVVLMSNAPVPYLAVTAAYLAVRGTPWVLWHQDVHSAALQNVASAHPTIRLRLAAKTMEALERWSSRRAAHIVAISSAFLSVHARWGTADKVTVIPNWAPLDELQPRDRSNAWAAQHALTGRKTLMYTGTLGLKHNPALLVSLAASVKEQGESVVLVVVNEGVAAEVLRECADRKDVPLELLPFQAYTVLPDVLGAGDILVVLLEETASDFSVPSKTLSYLCAERPIVGLMPESNPAAALIREAGGLVVPPNESQLDRAAAWLVEVLNDRDRARAIGRQGRALAESRFALEPIASAFESLLLSAMHTEPSLQLAH